MVLKEAFRYQNKLSQYLTEVENLLMVRSNITTTTVKLLLNKVNPEAADEEQVEEPTTEYSDKITSITLFGAFLIEEKEKLAAAITVAKRKADINIDDVISINECRRGFANILRDMLNVRAKSTIVRNGGTGYKFNSDGDQVSYKCDTQVKIDINYSMKHVSDLYSQLLEKSDNLSTRVDNIIITTHVDYTPPFSINATFDEAFTAFQNKL